MEAAVLLEFDRVEGWLPIFWHTPEGRTAGSLPDSRALWEQIWDARERTIGLAHSHPGSGIPMPSKEDVTTFAAVEMALGKRLFWWITSADHVVLCMHSGSGHRFDYVTTSDENFDEDPWVARLREISK